MIYDQDCNGIISVEETKEMLRARHGMANLEQKMTALFGAGSTPVELSLWEYVDAVKQETETTNVGETAPGTMSVDEVSPIAFIMADDDW
jgi:hypothetical protein